MGAPNIYFDEIGEEDEERKELVDLFFRMK
jgi:hypothetical protein